MIALPIAVAVALVAWGQPVLPPQPPPEPAAPAAAVVPVAPVAPAEPPAAAVPMIARAPLDVHILPVPAVTAPAAEVAPVTARRPLYKGWRFWAVSGSLFVATIATTYAVTRPEPPAYTGNTPPFSVSFR